MKALQGILLFILTCAVALLIWVNWTNITDKITPQTQEVEQQEQEDTTPNPEDGIQYPDIINPDDSDIIIPDDTEIETPNDDNNISGDIIVDGDIDVGDDTIDDDTISPNPNGAII